ncbi:AAC(3) family N-acetyltransferase [Nonomuraea rosea]|uniref:Aminoglycoside N(3)-acetyltransferase n=1 Tax=Nonomuraea rosea TaxID=638574 RepID=A0ABP6ZFD1_9ACTN
MIDYARLSHDFSALGVTFGQTVLLHSSLSSLGHTEGGADTVVAALLGLLGDGGTLVVPSGTSGNSDTSPFYRAAVAGMTPEEVAAFRARMPAYDPGSTPSVLMGRIPERVRTLPKAYRSAHPLTSFAAIGPQADEITREHARDCLLGELSPLSKLYDAKAHVLLLGVGYDRCTAFHLAEYRYRPDPPQRSYRAVVDDGDGRAWCEFVDVHVDDADFWRLGADFEVAGDVRLGWVGAAQARLFALTDAVDYATGWLTTHRTPATY